VNIAKCVDASSSGDQVRIATNTPVDEDIDLGDRGIELIPATTLTATYRPSFAPGRSIRAVTSAAVGDIAVSLRGLRLLDGSVTMHYRGTGSAVYDLRDLDLSPDGRWVVYVSNESGRSEVLLQRFDEQSNGSPPDPQTVAVSAGGGTAPGWLWAAPVAVPGRGVSWSA